VALQLLAISIENVIGRLALESGRPGPEIKFKWVDDEQIFEAPWKYLGSIQELRRDSKFTAEGGLPIPTPEDILSVYRVEGFSEAEER